MKKLLIALACMILSTSAAMAQKTFTFGPKSGVDYTHFWGKETPKGGMLNYQAGLFMEYRFNDKFSIAPEVVFASQGSKHDVTFIDKNPEGPYASLYGLFERPTTFQMNYINVPVMLKYYVIPSLSIDFGPQIGFNVYSKATYGEDKHGLKQKETVSQKEMTKSVDFGLGLGMTYNITENTFVQGRYTLGLTNAFENKEPHGIKKKNGNAQIAIGFRF